MAVSQDSNAVLPAQATPIRSARRPVPAITLLLCGICVAVFIGLMARGDDRSWDTLAVWGYVPADRIWGGAYWSLISSAFVHLALWHLAFNIYWLWVLGGAVERVIGPLSYLAFVLVAALVSSSLQLAVSGSTGHGASGIVYAMFGLIWAARKSVPALAESLGRNTGLFWTWLIGCIVVTHLGIAAVGNGAHVGGLVFGLLTAHWLVLKTPYRRVALGATALLVSLCLVTLFWSPWSWSWVGYKAYRAHAAGDYKAAIAGYRRSMTLGAPREWALENLVLVYQAMGAMSEYAATLDELRMVNAEAAARLESRVK
jgi:membrane associated rhomboid family serine protease